MATTAEIQQQITSLTDANKLLWNDLVPKKNDAANAYEALMSQKDKPDRGGTFFLNGTRYTSQSAYVAALQQDYDFKQEQFVTVAKAYNENLAQIKSLQAQTPSDATTTPAPTTAAPTTTPAPETTTPAPLVQDTQTPLDNQQQEQLQAAKSSTGNVDSNVAVPTEANVGSTQQPVAPSVEPRSLAAATNTRPNNSPDSKPPTSNKMTVGNKPDSSANQVFPNILHNYTNYTYVLGLYMLKNSEFNRLVVNPNTNVAKTLLLSSGGRTLNKDPNFSEDFYFEDLNMTTLVGLNMRSRETNAIEISFTIFEPNGCTLLDRLISVANTIAGAGEDNYLTMPYLLQIEFYGYDSDGTPTTIPVAAKIIPMTLIEMKIKPNLDGTRYSVRGVPYNQMALTNTTGVVPINCEIKAEKVAELFSSAKSSNSSKVDYRKVVDDRLSGLAAREKAEQSLKNARTESETKDANKRLKDSKDNVNKPVSAANLADVLNGWQEYLASEGIIGVPDQYDFQFDFDISRAKVILPQLNPVQDIPTNSEKTKKDPTELALAISVRNGIAGSASSTGVYRIFAGSNITNIIAQVVRHSSFIRDQIKLEKSAQAQNDATKDLVKGAVKIGTKVAVDAALTAATGGAAPIAMQLAGAAAGKGGAGVIPGAPGIAKELTGSKDAKKDGRDTAQDNKLTEEEILKWFKIVPSIELGEFDKIRNIYSRKITYKVSFYKSPNPRYPLAPQGQTKNYVKEYFYWYTGKNHDIISVDINFDAAFYTSVSLPSSAVTQNSVRPNMDSTGPSSQDQKRVSDARLMELRKTGLPFPVVRMPSKQLADIASSGKPSVDRTAIAVEDLTESLMSRSQGDMVVMKLDIVGDPDFIKQDGLFGENSSGGVKTQNGSLITDYERVVVKFRFNYPEDWTTDTGLLIPRKPTVFEGLYAIVKVDSRFERGQFKQSLEMYRLYETEYLPVANKSKGSDKGVSNTEKGSQILGKLKNAAGPITGSSPVAGTPIAGGPGIFGQAKAWADAAKIKGQ
jgi:hypothetical protein